jgi:tRNA threonylcarbamoyladenosine modification (KEOPS) complex  Pcc1 subunit
MKDQKRNNSVGLTLLLEHSEPGALSSGLITEADFSYSDDEISISLKSDSFTDLRARWNSVMRGLIASEQSIDATRGGD